MWLSEAIPWLSTIERRLELWRALEIESGLPGFLYFSWGGERQPFEPYSSLTTAWCDCSACPVCALEGPKFIDDSPKPIWTSTSLISFTIEIIRRRQKSIHCHLSLGSLAHLAFMRGEC